MLSKDMSILRIKKTPTLHSNARSSSVWSKPPNAGVGGGGGGKVYVLISINSNYKTFFPHSSEQI